MVTERYLEYLALNFVFNKTSYFETIDYTKIKNRILELESELLEPYVIDKTEKSE